MHKTTTVYRGYYQVVRVETPGGPREVIAATDSVAVLFFCPAKRSVLLVRQPRAAMITDQNPEGLITELVAGRFDVKLGAKELAVKEAKEELGATITEADVVMLNGGQPLALSAGLTTERSYLMYVVVRPEMITAEEGVFGVEAEGEQISRVWLSLEEFEDYACEDLRVFAMREWFFRQLKRKE